MSGDEGDGEVFNPWEYALTPAQAMFAQWCAENDKNPNGTTDAFGTFWEGLSTELRQALYTCDTYYKVSDGNYAKKYGSEQYAYADGTLVNADEVSESTSSSGRKAAFKKWATAISDDEWTRFTDNYKTSALSAVVDVPPAGSNSILYYRNLLRAMNAAEDDSAFTFTLPYVYTSQTNIILTLRVGEQSTLSFNEEIYDIGQIDDAAQSQLEQTLTVYTETLRAEQLNTTTSVDDSKQSTKGEIDQLRRVVDNLSEAIQTFESRKAIERRRLDAIETAIDASALAKDQNTSVVMRHIKRLASGPLVESKTQIGELFQAVAKLSAKVNAADDFVGQLQLEGQIRELQQGFTGILDTLAEERQTYSAVTASIRELQTEHADMRRLFRDIGELDFETKLVEVKHYAELTKQTALRNTGWIEGLRERLRELISALDRNSEKLSTTVANTMVAKISLAREFEEKRLQLSAVTYVSESDITSAADLSRSVDDQISDSPFSADSEPSRAVINVRINAAGHANVYDLALQFGAFYVLADAAARARLQPLPGENPLMHVAHVYWSVVPIQRGWHDANDIYHALFDGSGNVLRGAQPGPPAAGFKMADIQGFGAENAPLKPGSAYPMMVWSPRLGRPVLAAKTATGVPFYDALSMRGNHAAVSAALGAAFAEGGPKGAFDAALDREIDVLPPLNPVFENSFVMALRAGSRVEPLMVPEFALRPHCIAHNAALEEAFTFDDIDALNNAIRARFETYPHYSPDSPGAAVSEGVGSLLPPNSPVVVASIPSYVSTPSSADGPAPAFQLSPVVPTGNSLSPSHSPGGGGITADASVSLTNVSATSGPALPPRFPIDDLVLLPPDLQLGVEVKIIVRGVSGDSESSILGNAENTLESIGQNVLGGVSVAEALAFRETLAKHKIGGFAFEYPGNQGPPVDYKTYLRIAYETVRLTSTAKLGVWGMHHVENWGCFVFPGLQIGVGIVLKDGTVFGPDGRLYKNSRRRWTNDKLWQYDKKNFHYLKGNNAARLKTGLFETYKRVLHEVTGQKTLTTATLVLLKPDFDTPDSADSIAVFVAMGETELFWVAQNNTETLNTWSATDIHAADEIPWLCDITPDTNAIQDVFTESNKKIRDAGDVFPTFSSTAAPAASDDAVL